MVNSASQLFFYAGKGTGFFAAGVQKGQGWSGMTIAGGQDINGDGRADIVARQNSTRKLFLYPVVNSSVGFGTPVQIGSGW